jgi:hypothetical protein
MRRDITTVEFTCDVCHTKQIITEYKPKLPEGWQIIIGPRDEYRTYSYEACPKCSEDAQGP